MFEKNPGFSCCICCCMDVGVCTIDGVCGGIGIIFGEE
jgi:hypothetical protein